MFQTLLTAVETVQGERGEKEDQGQEFHFNPEGFGVRWVSVTIVKVLNQPKLIHYSNSLSSINAYHGWSGRGSAEC